SWPGAGSCAGDATDGRYGVTGGPSSAHAGSVRESAAAANVRREAGMAWQRKWNARSVAARSRTGNVRRLRRGSAALAASRPAQRHYRQRVVAVIAEAQHRMRIRQRNAGRVEMLLDEAVERAL